MTVLALSRRRLRGARGMRTLFVPGWNPASWRSVDGAGRALLLLFAVGMVAAGVTDRGALLGRLHGRAASRPAIAGAAQFAIGLVLSARRMLA